MRRVVFNGKFTAGALNGVHRVSARLIQEVDALLAQAAEPDDPSFSLVVPRGGGDKMRLGIVSVFEDDQPASQKWEQWRLPELAKGALLVNLANQIGRAHV